MSQIQALRPSARENTDFLSGANEYWPQVLVRDPRKGHIDTMLVYATSLLRGTMPTGSRNMVRQRPT